MGVIEEEFKPASEVPPIDFDKGKLLQSVDNDLQKNTRKGGIILVGVIMPIMYFAFYYYFIFLSFEGRMLIFGTTLFIGISGYLFPWMFFKHFFIWEQISMYENGVEIIETKKYFPSKYRYYPYGDIFSIDKTKRKILELTSPNRKYMEYLKDEISDQIITAHNNYDKKHSSIEKFGGNLDFECKNEMKVGKSNHRYLLLIPVIMYTIGTTAIVIRESLIEAIVSIALFIFALSLGYGYYFYVSFVPRIKFSREGILLTDWTYFDALLKKEPKFIPMDDILSVEKVRWEYHIITKDDKYVLGNDIGRYLPWTYLKWYLTEHTSVKVESDQFD